MSITEVRQEVPPHSSWVRRHPVRVVIAGSVIVAAAGCVAGAVASQGGSPGSMQVWRAGPGGQALVLVQSDLTQVADDSDAGLAVLATDGAQLTADADAAAASPLPPVDPSDYVAALADCAAAGQALASGDITSASIDLQAAATRLQLAHAEEK